MALHAICPRLYPASGRPADYRCRPLARKALRMEPMQSSDDQTQLSSSFGRQQLTPKPDPPNNADKKFNPAASSFAASAASTAAAMHSTFQEASHVLNQPEHQVQFDFKPAKFCSTCILVWLHDSLYCLLLLTCQMSQNCIVPKSRQF